MNTDIATKVIKIIAQHANLKEDHLTIGSRLTDLGIDSLGLVEIIFEIEESFGVCVPFNMNDPQRSDFDVSTVAAIVASVEGLIARQAA
jgi:acyl carrier protein